MENTINSRLEELSDEKYKKFSAKLIPNVTNVLGVRVPLLRKLAKTIVSDSTFDVNDFLSISSHKYLEFTMLQGFVIGLKKATVEEICSDISHFVPKIDNWAVCDGFCASLKIVKKYKQEIFEFLQKYIQSNDEYELRFGVVMLLNYYIEENYLDKVLTILIKLYHESYYAQMAIAWALSICYIKYFDYTNSFIKGSKMDAVIWKKTVRKVCESLQVSDEQKNIVKSMLK